MHLCKNCGTEIIFRHIEGIVRPICPNGCQGGADSPSQQQVLRFEHERDFCHPTRCPKCDASVFFIRHNDGSVWVDNLGWPWPKHPCFDLASDDPASFRILVDRTSQLQAVAGAVVTRIAFLPGAHECLAVVRKPGADAETWMVSGVEDPRKLLGALVAVSATDKKLVHAGGDAYDISEWIMSCAVCGAQVKQGAMDQHMTDRHRAVRCPACRVFVSGAALEAHLREHRRGDRERRKPRLKTRPHADGPKPEPAPAGAHTEGQTCPRGHGPLRSDRKSVV